MSKPVTIQQILDSACGERNPHLRALSKGEQGKGINGEEIGAIIASKKKRNKTKEWFEMNLWAWCKVNGLLLLKEQVFDEERKWRLDYVICGLKVAIEYEGISSEISRHTTKKGYTGDADKYNALQKDGLKLLRFTPLNHKRLITELEKLK